MKNLKTFDFQMKPEFKLMEILNEDEDNNEDAQNNLDADNDQDANRNLDEETNQNNNTTHTTSQNIKHTFFSLCFSLW